MESSGQMSGTFCQRLKSKYTAELTELRTSLETLQVDEMEVFEQDKFAAAVFSNLRAFYTSLEPLAAFAARRFECCHEQKHKRQHPFGRCLSRSAP